MDCIILWGWKFHRNCHMPVGALNLVRLFSVKSYCKRLLTFPAMQPMSRMLSVMGCPFERPNEPWHTKNGINWIPLGRKNKNMEMHQLSIHISLHKTGKCKKRWSVCTEHYTAVKGNGTEWKRKTCWIRRKEKQINIANNLVCQKEKGRKKQSADWSRFNLSLYPWILLPSKMLFRWGDGFCITSCNADLCPRMSSEDLHQLFTLKKKPQSQTSQISGPNLGVKIWNTHAICLQIQVSSMLNLFN